MAARENKLCTFYGLFLWCCLFMELSYSRDIRRTCDYSVSTMGTEALFRPVRVCVRPESATSLGVTWPSNTGSKVNYLKSVKNWILTVSASVDRKRLVSYNILESRESRLVVRALTPDTEYFVFLDSVDENGYYVTMALQALPVRTLTLDEEEEERYNKRRKEESGKETKHKGREVKPRPTRTAASTARRAERSKSNSSSRNNIITPASTTPSSTSTTTLYHRTIQQTEGKGPRTSEVVVLPGGISGSEIVTGSGTIEPGLSNSTLSEEAKSQGAEVELTEAKSRLPQERGGTGTGNAGRRLVMYVLMSIGAGFFLILVISAFTVLIHRRQKSAASVSLPHIEHELSTSSRTSTKVNNTMISTDSATGTGAAAAAAARDMTNIRFVSENGYTRTLSSPGSQRPLPPIIVSGNPGSSPGPEASYSGQPGNPSDKSESERTVYAVVSDLVKSDPGRIQSMISWGSEFDLIDEPKDSVYSNLSDPKSPDPIYNNMDTIYHNSPLPPPGAAAAAVSPSQAASPCLTSPASTTTTTATATPAESPQRPKKPIVSRPELALRQPSTSSIPPFHAPLPPLSPSASPATQPHPLSPSQERRLGQATVAAPPATLDLSKEQLQQLVVMLLANPQPQPAQQEVAAGNASLDLKGANDNTRHGVTGEELQPPASPAYLTPAKPSPLTQPRSRPKY